LLYLFLIISFVGIGIFIFSINRRWTNQSFEIIGLGSLSALITSLFRDFAVGEFNFMLIHHYILGFIFSLGLTFIGAISESQNKSI
jgi:hypothetical protein